MFWRKKKIADDLKAVTEIAGDQLAPGAGILILVLGGLATGAALTYFVARAHKRKDPKS